MSTQTQLETAANGLMMMSESDFPFEYFSTNEKQINNALILKLANKPAGTLIKQTTVDHLLRNMVNPASGSVNAATAKQFQTLASTLKQELTDLTVYRVGEVQVDVFITGLSLEGTVAGMRTMLIET
jgi:hypothetical protein